MVGTTLSVVRACLVDYLSPPLDERSTTSPPTLGNIGRSNSVSASMLKSFSVSQRSRLPKRCSIPSTKLTRIHAKYKRAHTKLSSSHRSRTCLLSTITRSRGTHARSHRSLTHIHTQHTQLLTSITHKYPQRAHISIHNEHTRILIEHTVITPSTQYSRRAHISIHTSTQVFMASTHVYSH